MSWATLRPEIKTLIDNISGISEVQAVPGLDFTGYPAVTITPSELSSDYETQAENLRTYAFQVRVFYNTKDGVGTAIENVEQTVDSIIDKIDEEEKTGQTRTIGAGLSSDAQILDIQPVIGPWGMVEDQDLVVSEISIRIRLSFDFSI